jgi:dihydrofolate reductase
MRKLVDYMFLSLDGFIADAQGQLDWVPDDGELTGFANEYFGSCDGIVFGRNNYQAFVEYWDGMDRDDPSNPTARGCFRSGVRRHDQGRRLQDAREGRRP